MTCIMTWSGKVKAWDWTWDMMTCMSSIWVHDEKCLPWHWYSGLSLSWPDDYIRHQSSSARRYLLCHGPSPVSVPTVLSSLLDLKTCQVRERGKLQNARHAFHTTLIFVHHLKTHSEVQSVFKGWILVSHSLLTNLARNDGYLINQLPRYS